MQIIKLQLSNLPFREGAACCWPSSPASAAAVRGWHAQQLQYTRTWRPYQAFHRAVGVRQLESLLWRTQARSCLNRVKSSAASSTRLTAEVAWPLHQMPSSSPPWSMARKTAGGAPTAFEQRRAVVLLQPGAAAGGGAPAPTWAVAVLVPGSV